MIPGKRVEDQSLAKTRMTLLYYNKRREQIALPVRWWDETLLAPLRSPLFRETQRVCLFTSKRFSPEEACGL